MRITLDARPEAAAFARSRVRDALVTHGMSARADTAVLLVSELVTNALRHGGGPHELVVALDADGVTVTVGDRSPASPRPRRAVHDVLRPPQRPQPDTRDTAAPAEGQRLRDAGLDEELLDDDGLSETGRGLLLVEALADTWGWKGTAGGKRVWFRLSRVP
jgi:anti-sigma regulatory factor (Ser/Thr protein kinase)